LWNAQNIHIYNNTLSFTCHYLFRHYRET